MICIIHEPANRKTIMPLVQIKLIEGVFSNKQKQDMLHRVTEAMLSVEGENLRPFTLVTIEETKSGDWAIGGKALTTKDVKALRAKQRKK